MMKPVNTATTVTSSTVNTEPSVQALHSIATRRIIIPFGPIQGVEWVSLHCLDRFRERVGVTGTAGKVLKRLEDWMRKARLVQLKPGKILPKMLNHGCRSANYYLIGNPRKGLGWILVVEGRTLKTIHRNDSGEWQIPSG